MIGMQCLRLFAAFATVCLFAGKVCTGDNGQIQKCENEGSRIESQNTVYQCNNGTLQPVGCLTENGTFLEDGKSYSTDSYMMQCQKIDKTNGIMKIVSIGCIKNGKLFAPSQIFIENSLWFTCQVQNAELGVLLQLSGCIGSDGEKVTINGTLTKGNYVFTCDAQALELKPTGCTYENGRFGFGDRMNVGQFWYQCEKFGENGVELKLKGCLDEGGLIYAGEIFHSKGFVLKCEQTATGLRRLGLGCLEVTDRHAVVEHGINETWTERGKSNGTVRYVVKCLQENTIGQQRRNGLSKTPVQCYFPGQSESELGMNLNPGCVSKRNESLLRCARTPTGGLKATVVDKSGPEHQAKAILDGLKFC